MACTDAVGSHPFPLRSHEITRPHHAWDLRQVPGDLSPESEQIESRGHYDCAIDVSEVRDKMCCFEQCGVPLTHLARIAHFVLMPSHERPLRRSPMRRSESFDDLSGQRPKAPPGLFIHERVFQPYVTSIGEHLVRNALRHDNQHATVLCPADGCEHTAQNVACEDSAESGGDRRRPRNGPTFFHPRLLLDVADRGIELLAPNRLECGRPVP